MTESTCTDVVLNATLLIDYENNNWDACAGGDYELPQIKVEFSYAYDWGHPVEGSFEIQQVYILKDDKKIDCRWMLDDDSWIELARIEEEAEKNRERERAKRIREMVAAKQKAAGFGGL